MLLPSRNEKLGAYNLLKRRSNRNNEITARCAKERVKEDKGQKSEAQTEWESRSEREEKRQTCWCCRDQQRSCRKAHALAENLEHTRYAEYKRLASKPTSD